MAAGLNCVLGYTQNGRSNLFRARCRAYTTGYIMVADEASSRVARAYYPHRVAPDRFSITLELKGSATNLSPNTEYELFVRWMAGYASYLLDPTATGFSRVMTVYITGRNVVRQGVPIQGVSFGDHVGATVWRPTIVFEAASDPSELVLTPPAISTFSDVSATSIEGQNAKYFYPSSQFANGTSDSYAYDMVVISTSSSVQNQVNAATNGSG